MKLASSQPLVTVAKGKQTILCNHETWLQRIFFPLHPCLTVAKRLISWDFPKKWHFEHHIWESFTKNVYFIEKFHEIKVFANVSHYSKGENILRNNNSWLQRRNNL